MTLYTKKCPDCGYLNTWRPYNFVKRETKEIVPVNDSGECKLLDEDGIAHEFRCICQNCGFQFKFKKVKITV